MKKNIDSGYSFRSFECIVFQLLSISLDMQTHDSRANGIKRYWNVVFIDKSEFH